MKRMGSCRVAIFVILSLKIVFFQHVQAMESERTSDLTKLVLGGTALLGCVLYQEINYQVKKYRAYKVDQEIQDVYRSTDPDAVPDPVAWAAKRRYFDKLNAAACEQKKYALITRLIDRLCE